MEDKRNDESEQIGGGAGDVLPGIDVNINKAMIVMHMVVHVHGTRHLCASIYVCAIFVRNPDTAGKCSQFKAWAHKR